MNLLFIIILLRLQDVTATDAINLLIKIDFECEVWAYAVHGCMNHLTPRLNESATSVQLELSSIGGGGH